MTSLDVMDRRRSCRRLRSKGMMIEVERGPEASWLPSMSDGFVWCARTQNCLGPDGRVADRQSCVKGRECFESLGGIE